MEKKKRSSNKQWREFELFVADIEEFLLPKGAIVKCPDYLVDKYTGKLREVDASISYTLGSVPVQISIECRDRKHKQDVTWVEQLATKRSDLGLSYTIGVSNLGFSEEAKRKARIHGILLRKLDKIKSSELGKLTGIDGSLILNIDYSGYKLRRATLEFNDIEDEKWAISYLSQLHQRSIQKEKIFHYVANETKISAMEIFEGSYKNALDHGDFNSVFIPNNGETDEMTMTISFTPPDEIHLSNGAIKVFVKEMTVVFVLFNKKESIPQNEKMLYHDEQSNEKLVAVNSFTPDDPTSFFEGFTHTMDLKTNKGRISTKGPDGKTYTNEY